jgi:decaprenylphospho-beta-D-ribofuranose 2-oxidase
MRAIEMDLSGWGNYMPQTCRVIRPERQRDLRQILTDGNDRACISRGLGRSYGDPALNDRGCVILHRRLNRLLAFNPGTGLLTCEAGVSLGEIIEVFLPRGYFIPVTPGTKFVTVGGAIAADVHGKNHRRDGTFSSFVESFDLLTGVGQVITCSREREPEAFWATVGGMGLTGMILTARFRLKRVDSAYINVEYRRTRDLDQALEMFGAGNDDYRYSVAWIDCLASGRSLGRSVLMRGDHAPVDDLPNALRRLPLVIRARRKKSVPFNLPALMLNPLSVKVFNALYYAMHRDGRKLIDYDSFFYPLDGVLHWNRMYGESGFIQYQALFPPETARRGIIDLLAAIAASKMASFLTTMKVTGPANDGLLSFPKPGLTLALDLPNVGRRLLGVVHHFDEIVLKHGGRLYLAKDATMSRLSFERMYDRLGEFRRVKARLDPDNRFVSSQARRLGIVEEE